MNRQVQDVLSDAPGIAKQAAKCISEDWQYNPSATFRRFRIMSPQTLQDKIRSAAKSTNGQESKKSIRELLAVRIQDEMARMGHKNVKVEYKFYRSFCFNPTTNHART